MLKEMYMIYLNANTSDSSKKHINPKNKTLFLFKMKTCGHCIKFEPIWQELQKIYDKKVNFLEFDVARSDKDRNIIENFKVEGFPTILLYTPKNEFYFYKDKNGRTLELMKQFIDKH